MAEGYERLRVFVAMPGTSMGERARWTDIPRIVRELLEPVRAELETKMACPVSLAIEKEKTSINPIHKSMFIEALTADVYIADLTGANPNVYLELGVRWALRDGVTIPIAQNVDDLKFNVSSTRAILYGPNGWRPATSSCAATFCLSPIFSIRIPRTPSGRQSGHTRRRSILPTE